MYISQFSSKNRFNFKFNLLKCNSKRLFIRKRSTAIGTPTETLKFVIRYFPSVHLFAVAHTSPKTCKNLQILQDLKDLKYFSFFCTGTHT